MAHMRVQIDIGLDFDGNHTFDWKPSTAPGAVDIPKTALERWALEREAFTLAYLRWKCVVEEIDETLHRAGEQRVTQVRRPAVATARVRRR